MRAIFFIGMERKANGQFARLPEIRLCSARCKAADPVDDKLLQGLVLVSKPLSSETISLLDINAMSTLNYNKSLLSKWEITLEQYVSQIVCKR